MLRKYVVKLEIDTYAHDFIRNSLRDEGGPVPPADFIAHLRGVLTEAISYELDNAAEALQTTRKPAIVNVEVAAIA